MSYSDIYIKNINYNNVYSILNILSIKKIDSNLNSTHEKKTSFIFANQKGFYVHTSFRTFSYFKVVVNTLCFKVIRF